MLSQVPAFALLAQADDDIDAVIFHVEGLTPALRAVAEHGHGFLAENGFPSLGRIVRSFDHSFHGVADFDLAHAGFLLLAHHKDTKGTKISNNFLCALCAFVVHFLVNWPSCTFAPTILYI